MRSSHSSKSLYLCNELNSNARQDYADEFPIYFDELFMSKFIEDFLDDQLTDESLADAF